MIITDAMRRPTAWTAALLGAVLTATLFSTPAAAAPAAPEATPPGYTAVVGGTRAVQGEFPWVVRTSGCGGSMVRPNVVLTAAHCLNGTGFTSSITVTGGAVDLQSPSRVTAQSRYIYSAPTFIDVDRGDDWALIQLDRSLPLPLLPIATDTSLNSGTFTIMGWGSTRSGGAQQRYLRKATVPLVSDATCGANYRAAGAGFVDAEMICAGFSSGGVDTCQGDSGGPMVKRDAAGAWRQVGIVSWGFGCAEAQYPGVYTEVSTFAAEINAAIANLPT